MTIRVGIDDLNVYGSTLTIPAAEIVRARGGAERTAAAAGLLRRSIPPGFEDPVTLAVNAARPLVSPDIDLLLVATESGVDYAKPLSSYVHHWLALSPACRHVELKHACYGGTAAVRLAEGWVRQRPGSRVLVVMTDMARRLFGDSAEPAEGAGAVALVVAAEPRVLTLDPWSGVAAREIYDVMRPTPALETIHSSLSLAAYLDLLEDAWARYASAAGPDALARLAHFAFHTPVPSLVRQAFATILDEEPGDELAARFERQVGPSLRYCRELGNTYSACLYAALAGLVDSGARGPVGLFSYGSGSCAEFFSGELHAEAGAVVGAHQIAAALAARREVDVARYQQLVIEGEQNQTAADHTPRRDLVDGLFEDAYRGRGRLILESVQRHYRQYAWS